MRRTLLLTIAVLALVAAPAAAQQRTIALPENFSPEGIASGKRDTFFAGSIMTGEVFRGSYETGRGSVLVESRPGRNHVGLKVDKRSNLLYVAGGESNAIYVYDARTGEDVRTYELPGSGFVNDVVVTRRAVYATDSNVQQYYRIDLDRKRRPGELTTVPITGDFVYGPGFNANGIEAVRGGRVLIMVQSSTGKLFRVRARSGRSREIELDRPVVNGDGILLRGRTLFVVQNQDEQIAAVKLRRRLREGRVTRIIRDRSFDVPATIARYKGFLYAVNARFPPNGDNLNPEEDVVRVRANGGQRLRRGRDRDKGKDRDRDKGRDRDKDRDRDDD